MVAAVRGDVMGGGFELSADLIVASQTAAFTCVEVTTGIVPLVGAVQRIAAAAGPYHAARIAMLSQPVTAANAAELNLVTEVIPGRGRFQGLGPGFPPGSSGWGRGELSILGVVGDRPRQRPLDEIVGDGFCLLAAADAGRVLRPRVPPRNCAPRWAGRGAEPAAPVPVISSMPTAPTTGGSPGSAAAGSVYRPCLLEVEDVDVPLVQEEIFAPVATFEVFDDETDALRRANATQFGLAAAVFTRDGARARRVSRDIEAGTVWTNTYFALDDGFAEGGYKQSGVGRLRGPLGQAEFQEAKTYVEVVPPLARNEESQ